MNHWAQMLTDLPATAHRLIARQQRISLPRGCSAELRLQRLRQALCHAATVRVTYAALDPAAQAALQELRARRGGMRIAEVAERYGTVRSWTQLAADPRPQTIAEHLLLLGWLVPRSATPHHPPRYLLPPELRRWLPHPLVVPSLGPAPTPSLPPVLRVVVALLLLATEQPLPIGRRGHIRCSVLQRLDQRLPWFALNQVAEIAAFALPLLEDLGLVARRDTTLITTIGGHRFLAQPTAAQLAHLQQAWLASGHPDDWLVRMLPDTTGLDWPTFRRRLWAWVSALSPDCLLESATLYPALAASFGPLADQQTHGFRRVARVPWQPRRSAAIFAAALHGPLHWLGLVDWHPGMSAEPLVARVESDWPSADVARPWHYGIVGEVRIPHDAPDAAVLDLLPFARWQHAAQTTTTYQLTAATLQQAVAAGHSLNRLWTLLEQRAGPLPVSWHTLLTPASQVVELTTTTVLRVEPPALLDRAARARSVRRYLAARPALGVALVEPDDVAALTRVLARQQIIATVKRQHHSVPASPPAALHPGDAAALLVACAFYQQHAPASAPLLPQPELLARLRTCLSRPLDAAVTAALADLSPPPLPTRPAPPSPLSSAEALPILTHALQAYTPIRMTYYTASRDAWSERVVRPLALEQCNDQWYLRAYCLSRQAERTFLVDRIGALVPLTQEQMLPASSGKPTTHEATLPLRAWETISVESLLAFG